MVDIVLVRSNSTVHDVRVGKIARSLSKRYSFMVLGWKREKILDISATDARNLKLLNLKAPFGRVSVILYYPVFWSWILLELLRFRPSVVHACDIDTVIPCYIYKIMIRRKLVFDLFDRYAMVYINPNSHILYALVNSLEEIFSRKSDVFITVSEKLVRRFKMPPQKYFIVMNCPEDHKKDSTKNDIFTLIYTGPVQRNRGLLQITSAIKDVSNVELVIAGRAIDGRLTDEILQLPNVKYQGLLKPLDALALEGLADVMIILYDLDTPQMNFVMPNKIFEAMMHGLPVITNVACELINETACGILVRYNDIDQIRKAILDLRDNKELCRRLGENGRKAFIEKYNWNVMEGKLYQIYDKLLSK